MVPKTAIHSKPRRGYGVYWLRGGTWCRQGNGAHLLERDVKRLVPHVAQVALAVLRPLMHAARTRALLAAARSCAPGRHRSPGAKLEPAGRRLVGDRCVRLRALGVLQQGTAGRFQCRGVDTTCPSFDAPARQPHRLRLARGQQTIGPPTCAPWTIGNIQQHWMHTQTRRVLRHSGEMQLQEGRTTSANGTGTTTTTET